MKLPYLACYDTTPYTAVLTSGVDENGQPLLLKTVNGYCRYNEKSKTVRAADGQYTAIEAVIVTEGDIAPEALSIAGEVTINSVARKIIFANRPRNPDGTVHHTKLVLG